VAKGKSSSKKEPEVKIPKTKSNFSYSEMQEKASERKQVRLELIKECNEKFGCNIVILKRLIGTPNIKRLTALLDGSIYSKDWFHKRTRTKVLEDMMKNTRFPKNLLVIMKDPKSKQEKA